MIMVTGIHRRVQIATLATLMLMRGQTEFRGLASAVIVTEEVRTDENSKQHTDDKVKNLELRIRS